MERTFHQTEAHGGSVPLLRYRSKGGWCDFCAASKETAQKGSESDVFVLLPRFDEIPETGELRLE